MSTHDQAMEEEGKIFVGGLSWDTTDEGLKNYFQSSFGEVTCCVIMKDSTTQRSRGFGFVTFKDSSNVKKVLEAGPHTLDGRKIDPKPAVPRGSQTSHPAPRGPNQMSNGLTRPARPGAMDPRAWNSHMMPGQGPPAAAAATGGASRAPYTGPTKKIFIGGLSPTTTEDEVRNFFANHGNVTEVILKYDQSNNRMRGFGFVTFDAESTVERLVEKHYVQINTKTVEIKKAEPRNLNQAAQSGYVQRPPSYWEQTYYPYGRHGAAYAPQASSGPYYHQGYNGAPSPYAGAHSYPSYSTTAYPGGHYNSSAAGPSYGSGAYTSYGAASGYGASASAGEYGSYGASTGQAGRHGSYHGESSAYAGSSAAAAAAGGAYGGDHSPVAMAYTGAGSSSYGQAPTTVTSSADGHSYATGVAYSAGGDYRPPAGAAAPSYAQHSPVQPGSAQGGQRQYQAY